MQDNGIEVSMRDITVENPSVEELTAWFNMSGKPIAKFFNTSGLKYKALNLKEAVKTKSDGELIEILATDGMIVKRPLLIKDGNVLIGFKEEEWRSFFNK